MDIEMNMVGLRAMLVYSVRKLLTNRRWIIIMLLAVLVGVVMGYSASISANALDQGSDLLNLLVLSFTLPIMAMIFGASMIRNEIDDRSITQVITSPVDRRVSYLGYYVALIIVLALSLLAVTAVGWSGFYLVSGISGDAVGLFMAYLAVILLGAFVYSSLFLAMGVVFRQPIYLGLIYAFIWEGFIGTLPGAVGNLTIMHQLRVIASSMIDHGSIASFSGDAVVSLVSLLLLTAILLFLGAYAFREKQVP
jgi:ABC-type transport system involved in multi-copper enzyme maturation permease subunit